MVATKAIGIGVTLVAVIIALIIFINFTKKLDIGKQFGDAGKGLTDFLNDLTNIGQSSSNSNNSNQTLPLSQPDSGLPNPANAPTAPTPIDRILADPNLTKDEQIEIIRNINLREDDPNSDLSKFNPDGIFGFGILGSDKQGIPIELAQELNLVGLSSSDLTTAQINEINRIATTGDKSELESITDIISRTSLIPSFPSASAEVQGAPEPQKLPTVDQFNAIEPENLNLNAILRNILSREVVIDSSTKDTETTKVNANTVDLTNSGKSFQTTIIKSGGSDFVGGFIRPTPIDPKKIRVDQENNPIETASERANRVFQETGNFVGIDRGASGARSFNFGTNTGTAPKLPTVNRGGESVSKDTRTRAQQIEEAKRLAEQRAKSVFDSSKIQRF